MRIPVISAPSEAPRPVGTPFTRSEASPADFGAGLGKALQDAAGVANQYSVQADERAQLAKQKAQAANVLDADTLVSNGFRDVLDKPETGYLTSTAGRAAMEARAPTHEALQKIVDGAAKNLKTPEEAAAFKQRAAQRLEHALGRVESHAAGGLKVAALASSEGAYKAALENVAAAPENLRAEFASMLGPLAVMSQNTGTPIEALQEKFKRDAAETALRTMLAREDAAGAKQLLADHPFLASHTKQVEALGIDNKAEVDAQVSLPLVLKASGEVDFAKVQELVDAIPIGLQQDAYRARLERRAGVAQKVWHERASKLGARAVDLGQVIGETGTPRFSWDAIPAGVRTELEQTDPVQADRWKRKSVLDAAVESRVVDREQKAAIYREQLGNYSSALQDFAWNKDEVAALTRDDFIARYQPGMTQGQFTQLAVRFENLKKNADRLTEESVVHARALAVLGLPKGSPIPDDEMPRFVAYADQARDEIKRWETDHGGKKPNSIDMEAILKRVEAEVYLGEKGFFGGEKKGPAFDKRAKDDAARAGTVQFNPGRPAPKAAPAPAAKTPTAYRYNKDRTSRVPVYADGSSGTPEAGKW